MKQVSYIFIFLLLFYYHSDSDLRITKKSKLEPLIFNG